MCSQHTTLSWQVCGAVVRQQFVSVCLQARVQAELRFSWLKVRCAQLLVQAEATIEHVAALPCTARNSNAPAC